MAEPVTDQHDSLSEYGSDFTPDEEELLSGLLQQVPDQGDNPNTDPNRQLGDIEDDEGPRGARIPRRLAREDHDRQIAFAQTPEKKRATNEIDDGDAIATIIESPNRRREREGSASIEAPLDPKPEKPDLRSPLERFRTKPKKALSVTDLVSPAWCELQYWYTLTKHGRKRRTPAMKQGSAVHKTLEDQVHTTVKVEITSNEDAWGLRIWNIIQGLKTLRETGMTRELEVWGMIDGLVINGVIDELSYTCPDPELEESEEKGKALKALPASQTTIADFLGRKTFGGNGLGVLKNIYDPHRKASKVYITDVKTRGTRSIPKGASFRPTLMQLLLYHKLLSNLATNKVDADILFNRYNLDPKVQFSDGFIAQIGSLNESYEGSSSSSQGGFTNSTQDSMSVLLSHNSLHSLWGLMLTEFALTMPLGTESIGNVLKAEYRAQGDGGILGVKSFLYDESTVEKYLDEGMKWWKGEREAQGVCVEEAYKCGSCDFFGECSWRKNKIEEATSRMREKIKSVV
ncbi:exonuclease V, partial [Lecanoromycetidae sp. Uapishka_2]